MSQHSEDQHEALHACYIVQKTLEDHVLLSTFVRRNPDIADKAKEAEDAMAALYQEIGRA